MSVFFLCHQLSGVEFQETDADTFPQLNAEQQATWYCGTEVADVRHSYVA